MEIQRGSMVILDRVCIPPPPSGSFLNLEGRARGGAQGFRQPLLPIFHWF